MEDLFNAIIKCEKCLPLGVEYRKERKENLNLAYHKFLPTPVKMLWVLESPPKSDPPRYFYRLELTRYDGLYREMMKCLGIEPGDLKIGGLQEFQRMGHFLIDIAKCPVDKDNVTLRPQMIKNCSEIFMKEVLSLNPQKILIIKANVYQPALESLAEIRLRSRVVNAGPIPFPSNGHQREFCYEARKILMKIKD
jgi:hypothetical protein